MRIVSNPMEEIEDLCNKGNFFVLLTLRDLSDGRFS